MPSRRPPRLPTEAEYQQMVKARAEKESQLAQAEGAKREILRQMGEKYGAKTVKAGERALAELKEEEKAAEERAAARTEEVREACPELFGDAE